MIGIAALAENSVIGDGNKIPWHIPDDFKWFKKATMGHALLMGRKTFESIGRPLPGRKTYVLSRTNFMADGVATISDISQAYTEEGQELFLCGGGELYKQFLPLCKMLYLTHVFGQADGDVKFPDYSLFVPNKRVVTHNEFIVVEYVKKV